jgi:hypothetical protein
VTECVVNSGQVQAFMSVNKDYDNSRVQPNVSIGVDGYYDKEVIPPIVIVVVLTGHVREKEHC